MNHEEEDFGGVKRADVRGCCGWSGGRHSRAPGEWVETNGGAGSCDAERGADGAARHPYHAGRSLARAAWRGAVILGAAILLAVTGGFTGFAAEVVDRIDWPGFL